MKHGYRVLAVKNKNFFLPENYPGSVRGRYMSYVNYNFLQQGSSTALGVLSTQQLLLALGSESLTASAALNWVIKDGLGQLGGVLYAGKTGNRFDIDPKYQKWISAVSINLACVIEIISPLYPGYFLLLASIGTFGKNISAISGSASRAAIHLNFSNNNNLADITAKNTIQTTTACIIGTFIGTFCGYYVSSYTLGASYFLGFSAIHLYSAFKGLKVIEMNSLNQQRLDIIIEEYIKSGKVLNVEEVAQREVFWKKYRNEKVRVGTGKVFEDFVKYDRFIVAQEGELVHLVFDEQANSLDMICGYIKAIERVLGVSVLGLFERLSEKGWNTSLSYISPNSIRIKFDS